MNKKEYIPFHAKALMHSANQTNTMLYYNKEGNEIKTWAISQNKIDSEEKLEILLLNKAKIEDYTSSDFTRAYVEYLYQNGSAEHRQFFLANNKSLVGSLSGLDFNHILKNQTEELAIEMITQGTQTFGIFNANQFKQTANIVKDYDSGAESLMVYLVKREKTIKTEAEWVSVRDVLLENFLHELDVFKSLPVVANYLNAQKSNESIVMPTEIASTIYIPFNCNIAKNIYPIQGAKLDVYRDSLKFLMKELEHNKEQTGVVKIHVQDSRENQVYKFSHVYVNLNESSTMTRAKCIELIESYFQYAQRNIITDKISENIEQWVSKKLFNDKLGNELSIKDSSVKLLKI